MKLGYDGVSIYVKETMQVNLRTDLMFDCIEAIWVEIRQRGAKYSISCIYRPVSATTEYCERNVDMFECARKTGYPVIYPGDLDFDCILDETLSTNPIHYIETAYDMGQLNDQPTWVDDKTSSVLDVILTSHLTLHRKSAVFECTLSDHYFIYTYMKLQNVKSSVVGQTSVRFVT